jgi:hypothetical protein
MIAPRTHARPCHKGAGRQLHSDSPHVSPTTVVRSRPRRCPDSPTNSKPSCRRLRCATGHRPRSLLPSPSPPPPGQSSSCAIHAPLSTPRAQPRRRPHAGEAPPCPSPRRLPCAGDVATTEHVRRATVRRDITRTASRVLAPGPRALSHRATLGQAVGHTRCVGRPHRYCATVPRQIRPSDS